MKKKKIKMPTLKLVILFSLPFMINFLAMPLIVNKNIVSHHFKYWLTNNSVIYIKFQVLYSSSSMLFEFLFKLLLKQLKIWTKHL